MAKWRKNFKLKDLLEQDEEEDPDAEACRIGSIVAERLYEEKPVANYAALALRFQTIHGEGGFNRALAELYDAADRELVWVE